MRTLFAVLMAVLLLAPAATASESIQPLHGCEDDPDNPDAHCHDDDKDSPGLGALAFVGLVGLALMARRRA